MIIDFIREDKNQWVMVTLGGNETVNVQTKSPIGTKNDHQRGHFGSFDQSLCFKSVKVHRRLTLLHWSRNLTDRVTVRRGRGQNTWSGTEAVFQDSGPVGWSKAGKRRTGRKSRRWCS